MSLMHYTADHPANNHAASLNFSIFEFHDFIKLKFHFFKIYLTYKFGYVSVSNPFRIKEIHKIFAKAFP